MGVVIVDPEELTLAAGQHAGGWMETGNLDTRGHALGADLVKIIKDEIDSLADRVSGLLRGGWKKVRIVTDHGWLLLPGNLPKVEIPPYLVGRKGVRAAAVKGASKVDQPTYPWHWNPDVLVVSPEGIHAFYAEEYAHGGVTLQECVVPDILVESGAPASRGKIVSVSWRGLRCTVKLENVEGEIFVDLRTRAGDATTSVLESPKSVKGTEASVLVEDEAKEGAAVTVVIMDSGKGVIAKQATVVGGE